MLLTLFFFCYICYVFPILGIFKLHICTIKFYLLSYMQGIVRIIGCYLFQKRIDGVFGSIRREILKTASNIEAFPPKAVL